MPFAFFPTQLLIVHGCHRHKSRTYALGVLLLKAGITLHVRLSKTQVNVEILVLRLHGSNRPKSQDSNKQFLHINNKMFYVSFFGAKLANYFRMDKSIRCIYL